MKNKASLKNKIYRKIHWFIFKHVKPKNEWYPAFRHGMKYAMKHGKNINEIVSDNCDVKEVYITQIPNEGAGIGHQIANYIGGYHYSRIFGASHAYVPFKDTAWDRFLGFGENEVTLLELKKQGYKVRRLPYFDEQKNYAMIRNIVDSYSGEKVVLLTELDQFYPAQYEEIPHIKEKFESSSSRKNDRLIFSQDEYNVAVHIRRGDIVQNSDEKTDALTKRWLDMDYYEGIVKKLVDEYKGIKPIHLYIFSQGKPDEYALFNKYGKVTLCMDMSAMDSFLHMVRADVLVTSKSSFSYKPALLSDGIRIVPSGFWHGYPDDEKWKIVEL